MLISSLFKQSYLSFIVCLRGNAVTCIDAHCLSSSGPTETDVPQLNARKFPNIDNVVAQLCNAVAQLCIVLAQWRNAVAQWRTAVT
jgi:hypothetical protein